jgi:hypothetical protein
MPLPLVVAVLGAALILGVLVVLRRIDARDERGQSLSLETVVIIGIAVVLAVGVGVWAVGKLTAAQNSVPDPNPPAIGG